MRGELHSVGAARDQWLGADAPWVRSLLCKLEDLIQIPSTHAKWGMAGSTQL